MTQVTISIVSHGHGALMDLLLTDIERLQPQSVAQIVVTLNVAEPWKPPPRIGDIDITVIRNQVPAGFGANHNRAFLQCKTPIFAVLNPDLRLPQDPFPGLLVRLAKQRCGMAVPWQVDAQGMVEDFRRKLPTPLSLTRRSLRALRAVDKELTCTEELDWVAGSFMAMHSDVFAAIGGFDEGYRLYCEDVDICLRLQLAGWRIAVAAQPAVVHDARRDSGSGGRHLRWHLQSFCRLWASRTYWRYLGWRTRRPAT